MGKTWFSRLRQDISTKSPSDPSWVAKPLGIGMDALLMNSKSFNDANAEDTPFPRAITEGTCRLLAPLL